MWTLTLGDLIEKFNKESESFLSTLDEEYLVQQDVENEKSALRTSNEEFAAVEHDINNSEELIERVLNDIDDKHKAIAHFIATSEL